MASISHSTPQDECGSNKEPSYGSFSHHSSKICSSKGLDNSTLVSLLCSVLESSFAGTLVSSLKRHIHTLLLFTWTDYKTIFIPITVFACATAPIDLNTPSRLFLGMIWIWVHLLLCNVSNQARSLQEDSINRPWRPIPSGRLTTAEAVTLRWFLTAACTTWSATYGTDLLTVTICLAATTWIYDEGGMSNHCVGKNMCNIGGYTMFEVGATKIIGARQELDEISTMAVVLSGILIFTTIQAQDFQDVEGDEASGRVTFPIYAPELSRVFTLIVLPVWSIMLAWYWQLGPICWTILIIFGACVGLRYYFLRSVDADKVSYIIFNLYLVCVHILPLHARYGVLHF